MVCEAVIKSTFLAESLNSDSSRGECLTYGQTGLISPFSIQEEPDVFLENGWESSCNVQFETWLSQIY